MTQFQCPYNGNISGIYALIENRPGHKYYGLPRYIGQSVNIKNRWLKGHLTENQDNYKNRIVRAHQRVGTEIVVKTLIVCESQDLDLYEQQLITMYKPTLVNVSSGGKRADCVAGGAASISKVHTALQANKKGLFCFWDKNKHHAVSVQGGIVAGNATPLTQLKEMAERSHNSPKFHQAIKDVGNSEENLKRLKILGQQSAESGRSKIASDKFVIAAKAKREHALAELGFPPNYKIGREDARKHGIRFFYGEVCPVHPDKQGLRRTKDNSCSGCACKGKK